MRGGTTWRGCAMPRQAHISGGKGRAAAWFCNRPEEGREGTHGHIGRTLCGVQHGGNRVGESKSYGLCDGGVAVHPSLRRKLAGWWLTVLRWVADGPVIPADLRVRVRASLRQASEDLVHGPVGHSRSLAHSGTATGRKERLQGTRLVSVAQHGSQLRVAVNINKGAKA